MRSSKFIFIVLSLSLLSIFQTGCNYLTHRTLSVDNPYDSTKSDQDPNYNVSLDFNYQDFTSYLYMGNRVENFTAYFNTFYRSKEDYDDAYEEYRASLISFYNRRLDSLGITPLISGSVKDKLDKAIERSSKIIQFHKNSKFIDDAVLIIGKSYFFETDYYKAERTFNEFLSKFSTSVLADEAILFLGRTKVKLGKDDEGIKIFKDLEDRSTDNEVRSQAARELGILTYNSRNYDEAANYFKASIDFSRDKERKAEGQFILAKILSVHKPELAAQEYKKVVDYTSDFDLLFYARLNYAKGLINNKDYNNAGSELEVLRRKYRDEPSFTRLVDLEIANNLYEQKKYPEALEKYYEVIVKYANTASASDAYYHLARHEEDINKNYLTAFVNYKKAVQEDATSDYFKESSLKSSTFEKYFTLLDEVGDTNKIEIPEVNPDVEKFRRKYNEEKGIEQQIEEKKNPQDNGDRDNGDRGGKGKPGGFKTNYFAARDSVEKTEEEQKIPEAGPEPPPKELMKQKEQKRNNTGNDTMKVIEGDSSITEMNDSVKGVRDSIETKAKDDKTFNAYYEIAEIFIYNLNQQDSAEHYLKILLDKFSDSDRQSKLLYTLGNFYKNNDRKTEADETFSKIISNYPNTIYANESKKILGIRTTETEFTKSPADQFLRQALDLMNENKSAEAIVVLQDFISKYPEDTLVAKALFGIGWIYENKLVNKDSSVFYYKKLQELFPQSQYTVNVTPKLEYIASLEVKDSTGVIKENPDSTNVEGEIGLDPEKQNESVINTKKDENPEEVKEEVKIDTTGTGEENKLSQEEIDKLLKETEQPAEQPTDGK
ncbi:MAG: tetratricopeptide repeat protein [Ignavibacteria bacterium]